jgi:hypothetical protein
LVAEVGPIKYVGDMIYGVDDDNALDKAVRLVIMLIMVVFDPLAVLLLIAANMTMKEPKEPVENKVWNDLMEGQPKEYVEEPVDTHAYLKEPFKHFENLQPIVQTKEEPVPVTVVEEDTGPQLTEEFKQHMEKWKVKETTVEVPTENITTIEEPQPIVIDDVTGETIPPLDSPGVQIRREELIPGLHAEHHEEVPPAKKLEPKYDYNEPFAFKEKDNK